MPSVPNLKHVISNNCIFIMMLDCTYSPPSDNLPPFEPPERQFLLVMLVIVTKLKY